MLYKFLTVLTSVTLFSFSLAATPLVFTNQGGVSLLGGKTVVCLDIQLITPNGEETLDFTITQSTNPFHLQAAYLVGLVDNNVITWNAAQKATWYLANPVGIADPGVKATLSFLDNINITGLTATLYTPLKPGVQSFIGSIQNTHVPEPATLCLLGVGLLGVASRLRKR